mgnify:FL=1
MNNENKTLRRNWALGMHQNITRVGNIAHEQQLKYSKYNISVKLKDKGELLFNSVTKALSRLSTDESLELSSLKEGGSASSCNNAQLISTLAGDGFFVPAAHDELSIVRDVYFATRHNKSTLALTVAPTMACNLACGYCFQGLDKDLSKLGKDVPDGIVDLVKSQIGTLSALNMTWYGGEPLMAKKEIFDLADRLITLCDMNGIQYSSSMVTNGYFLTPKVAEQLWTRRCTSVQITVDGEEATHDKMRPQITGKGSFKTIIKNISDVLTLSPIHIALRVNVGRQNVNECKSLLDDFERRGFAQRKNFTVYFAPIDAATSESGTAFEDALGKKEFNDFVLSLSNTAREMGLAPPIEAPKGILGMCVAAMDNGYVITHKGDIHKCWETAHDESKRIGTIFKPDELNNSLNASVWSAWSPYESEICKSCKILPMCGGFCGHRTIYQGLGDDQALPCPDWKWNTAEYIFSRAKHVGVVKSEEWDPEEASAEKMQTGERHTIDSLRASQMTVFEKVGKSRGEKINIDEFLHGPGPKRIIESDLELIAVKIIN